MSKICSRIKSKRRTGRTTCAIYHGQEILPRKARLKNLGFRDIPERLWVPMHRHEAAKLLTYCLAQDLAYGTKIMEREAARDLAEGFLSNFDADVKFLANTRRFCDDFEGSYFSWEPISRATIDTGVLVEANGVAGILWVEDMD